MNKNRQKCVFLFSILFVFSISSEAKKSELPEKYKKWMNEDVIYIITPKEKEVFYELETDKERDIFIEEFWRQRDPTPGISRNELKEEHYRRIEYANQMFGRRIPEKGWRTDRGRVYIKLGEPVQIQKFLNSREIYPMEIWYYQGNPKFGQATSFRLLFFQRNGMGEFELYSPMVDGPRSLSPLIWVYEDSSSPSAPDVAAHKLIKERVSNDLADASLSCFLGRSSWDSRMPSSILIGEIELYPHKKVKDDYAFEFLEHKAIVEVSYSVNYIKNLSKVCVIQNQSGLFLVNLCIEPETFSVEFYGNKYLTNLKTSIRITDLNEKTIFQQEKNYPVELNKEQLKKIGQRPVNLYDSFPLIPGNYKFYLLLENLSTKEFTSIEKDILVPTPESLQMGSLILANRVNMSSTRNQSKRVFQVGNLQIYPSLRKKFFKKDKLFIFFQIHGLSQELVEDGILEFSFYKGYEEFYTLTRKVREYENKKDFLQEFSLEKFLPEIYKVKVSLLDREGKEVLSNEEEFSVSSKLLPQSWIITQTNPLEDDSLYFYQLGNQFLIKGEVEKARNELEKAHNGKPNSLDCALSYAKVLLLLKRYKKVKEILLPFLKAKKENFTLFYFLGKSSQEGGRLEDAISYYQKALSHKADVVKVLNLIGECYFLLGDNDEAIQVWLKSLEINPAQERMKKAIEILKEKK